MTIVPVPPKCSLLGPMPKRAGSCTIDADCNVGTLSAKSSFQFDGKHPLKATIKGATGPSGAPLQTDGIAGTTDDYILELDANRRDYTDILCPVPGCPEALVVAKVDFKKGKAKVALDISSILPAAPNGMPVPDPRRQSAPPAHDARRVSRRQLRRRSR